MSEQKKDLFDVLRDVVNLLKILDVSDQKKVIRWSLEELNLDLLGAHEQQILPDKKLTDIKYETCLSKENFISNCSIKDFVLSKNPISDINFAVTVAYFYQFETAEKKDLISKEDLIEATRLVGRERLVRPEQTLINAMNCGYLDKVERGLYRLNSIGENLVAMTLPIKGEDGSRKKNKKRLKSKKIKKSSKNKK